MKNFPWDNHRREDGTIDLASAFEQWSPLYSGDPLNPHRKAVDYLHMIERISSIKSRQAAAIALANATQMKG